MEESIASIDEVPAPSGVTDSSSLPILATLVLPEDVIMDSIHGGFHERTLKAQEAVEAQRILVEDLEAKLKEARAKIITLEHHVDDAARSVHGCDEDLLHRLLVEYEKAHAIDNERGKPRKGKKAGTAAASLFLRHAHAIRVMLAQGNAVEAGMQLLYNLRCLHQCRGDIDCLFVDRASSTQLQNLLADLMVVYPFTIETSDFLNLRQHPAYQRPWIVWRTRSFWDEALQTIGLPQFARSAYHSWQHPEVVQALEGIPTKSNEYRALSQARVRMLNRMGHDQAAKRYAEAIGVTEDESPSLHLDPSSPNTSVPEEMEHDLNQEGGDQDERGEDEDISHTSSQPDEGDSSDESVQMYKGKRKAAAYSGMKKRRSLLAAALSAPNPAEPQPLARPDHGGRMCLHCGVTETPMWRSGPAGKQSLCNACGAYFLAHGTLADRPRVPSIRPTRVEKEVVVESTRKSGRVRRAGSYGEEEYD